MKKKPIVEKCSCYGGFDCPVCNPKKYKQPSKSANDWLAEILQASGPTGKVDKIPEGWLTIAQMSELTETSMSTINHQMLRRLKAGQVQRKQFRIKTDRQVTHVWHYYKA